MQYPHWLMVAGAVLVAIGFIGLAFRRNRDGERDHEPTEGTANGKRDGRDSDAATPPPLAIAPATSRALSAHHAEGEVELGDAAARTARHFRLRDLSLLWRLDNLPTTALS